MTELKRLHPLTPVLRSWQLFVAAAVFVVPQLLENTFGLGGDREPLGGWALVAVAAAPVVLGYGFLSWRFTGYVVEPGALRIDSGILFRSSRRVRLDRLQAVDVVQPLVARPLGLAELRLEVVGGGETEAPLAYVGLREAHDLRARLLAQAAGLDESTPEAPERPLLAVPADRLLASTLLGVDFLATVAMLPFGVAAAVLLEGGVAVLVVLPMVAGAVRAVWQQFVANFGFTLAESPDGLRLRRGLLETRASTVPPGRIQAIRLREPWLWRRTTGWAALTVDIAGYGAQSGGEGDASGTLLPVARREEAVRLLHHVLPGLELDGVPLRGVPRRARLLDPFAWHVIAAGSSDRWFVSRRGWLTRTTDVMPLERAQSVAWRQGPLQRLRGVASVHLHTTPGPVDVVAPHRDVDEALAMVFEVSAKARRARETAVPDVWMAAGPPPPPAATSSPDDPGADQAGPPVPGPATGPFAGP